MSLVVRHTVALTWRQLLALWRQPWFVAITLVQPMIWLLLFGALFKRVVEIPGYHGGSYIQFLTPGVVVMSALFSAGWHGMGLINAIERGILDRLLVSPVRRGAVIAAGVAQQAVVIVIQTLVIIGVAYAVGARFSATAVLLMIGLSALLGAAVCALSDGLALVARQEETLIGAVQFVALPATFLSSGLMASNPDAGLGGRHRALQSGELGGRGLQVGGLLRDRLVARRHAHRVPRCASARLRHARYPRLRRVSALRLRPA